MVNFSVGFSNFKTCLVYVVVTAFVHEPINDGGKGMTTIRVFSELTSCLIIQHRTEYTILLQGLLLE